MVAHWYRKFEHLEYGFCGRCAISSFWDKAIIVSGVVISSASGFLGGHVDRLESEQLRSNSLFAVVSVFAFRTSIAPRIATLLHIHRGQEPIQSLVDNIVASTSV